MKKIELKWWDCFGESTSPKPLILLNDFLTEENICELGDLPEPKLLLLRDWCRLWQDNHSVWRGRGSYNLPEVVKQIESTLLSKGTDTRTEYFTSKESAAEYAGVTRRTISNWLQREWLTAENVGRKIRIKKADLDKCRDRQNKPVK